MFGMAWHRHMLHLPRRTECTAQQCSCKYIGCRFPAPSHREHQHPAPCTFLPYTELGNHCSHSQEFSVRLACCLRHIMNALYGYSYSMFGAQPFAPNTVLNGCIRCSAERVKTKGASGANALLVPLIRLVTAVYTKKGICFSVEFRYVTEKSKSK